MASEADRAFLAFQADGDSRDLATVFDSVAPELYQFACHLSGDPNTAEDLLQEAFLTAIEKRGDYEPRAGVAAWLNGVLANRAHEQRRRMRRKLDPDRLHRLQEGEDPMDASERAELTESVTAAIAELPEQYAVVLRLYLQQGLAAAEIASALDRPGGTVRTQIVRGLEALRKALPIGLAGVVGVASRASLEAQSVAVLGRVREQVLSRVGVNTGGVVTASTLFGVLSMKKVLSFAAALFVVLGSVVWWDFANASDLQDTRKSESLVVSGDQGAAEQSNAKQLERQPVDTSRDREQPAADVHGVVTGAAGPDRGRDGVCPAVAAGPRAHASSAAGL